MNQTINKLIKHPLISGSIVVFTGSTIASFLYYLFNLLMGRLLSVADYGILAALMSIWGIFAVFSSTITTVFTKFSAAFVVGEKRNLINKLLRKGFIWIGALSLVICLGIYIFIGKLEGYLHIYNTVLISYIIISLFFSFLLAMLFGILQGTLRLFPYSAVAVVIALSKIIIGVFLVYFLGYKVYGAVVAVLISTVAGIFLACFFLKDFLYPEKEYKLLEIPLKKTIGKYALPVFFSSLGITLFLSLDVILVKHYFSDVTAGKYAALAIMGKSITYFIGPIMLVFFPLIAQKREKKESVTGTLVLTACITGIPVLLLCVVYFMFPAVILGIFFPAAAYSSLSNNLGYFALYMLIYNFASLLSNFFLSIEKTYVPACVWIVAAVLEYMYIMLYHQTIFQIVIGLIVISALVFIALVFYYPFAIRSTHT